MASRGRTRTFGDEPAKAGPVAVSIDGHQIIIDPTLETRGSLVMRDRILATDAIAAEGFDPRSNNGQLWLCVMIWLKARRVIDGLTLGDVLDGVSLDDFTSVTDDSGDDDPEGSGAGS